MQDSFTRKQATKYRSNFKDIFLKFPVKGIPYQQEYVEKYESTIFQKSQNTKNM